MEPVPVKPGYLSTEFWMTLGAQVIALLVLFGIVGKDEQQTAQDAISHAIQNAAALIGSALAIWKYIQSRATTKAAASNAQAVVSDNQVKLASLAAGSRGMMSLLLIGLFFCSSLSAADINLVLSGGKLYTATKDATGIPVLTPGVPLGISLLNLDGGTSTPTTPPTVPPVVPGTPFSKEVARLTSESMTAGGAGTTAAAISSVYSLVAEGVADGSTAPDKALDAVKFMISGLMATQSDRDKWTVFRTSLGTALDKLRQDGSLSTKAQYVTTFREISAGMNSVTGFNGNLTTPEQRIGGPNAGILGNIDIAKLVELLKMLFELYKLFKGGI